LCLEHQSLKFVVLLVRQSPKAFLPLAVSHHRASHRDRGAGELFPAAHRKVAWCAERNRALISNPVLRLSRNGPERHREGPCAATRISRERPRCTTRRG